MGLTFPSMGLPLGVLHACFILYMRPHRCCKDVLSYSVCQRGLGTWPQSSCVGPHRCCFALCPTDWLACSCHRSHIHSTGRRKASLSPCKKQVNAVFTTDQKKTMSQQMFETKIHSPCSVWNEGTFYIVNKPLGLITTCCWSLILSSDKLHMETHYK